MKLLTLTTRYLIVLVLIVLALWTAIFHFTIQKVVYFEMDEHLYARTFEIIQFVKENPALLQKPDKLHQPDFIIYPISQQAYQSFYNLYPNGKYIDFLRFVKAENEEEPFRKLETVFKNQNNYYQIDIEVSVVDAKEMRNVILLNIIGLSVVLAIFILIFNRMLLQTLWKPFYITLHNIKQYRLDNHHNLQLNLTRIAEFKELNSSFQNMIDRNQQVYLQQKQFIENASHEIQTPLSIVMSKLEIFTESEHLNEVQADLIKSVRENLERLSRLNRSLLLLSKIDNRQFIANSTIAVVQLLKKILTDYEEMTEFKKLHCQLEIKGNPQIFVNADLAHILFSNLLRNAIFHNYSGGFINILIDNTQITITNSGKENTNPPDQMFERFRKGDESSFSQGLGLAIVAAICQLYSFKINYTVQHESHSILLLF